jgi:hypothetical protein
MQKIALICIPTVTSQKVRALLERNLILKSISVHAPSCVHIHRPIATIHMLIGTIVIFGGVVVIARKVVGAWSKVVLGLVSTAIGGVMAVILTLTVVWIHLVRTLAVIRQRSIIGITRIIGKMTRRR